MKISDLKLEIEMEVISGNSAVKELEFYPPQEEAIKAGLLDTNKNFVIATPTASGENAVSRVDNVKIDFNRFGEMPLCRAPECLGIREISEF